LGKLENFWRKLEIFGELRKALGVSLENSEVL
jgi:hypothetical protein